MQLLNYRFKPRLVPTIATLLLLPVLINLGLWQSNKAEQKQSQQDLFEKRGSDALINIGPDEVNLETVRYYRVLARGKYEPEYQVLLDNQINKSQAGYHVITPLQISGSNMRILVNRGWIPLGADRNLLPLVTTPEGDVEITGYAHDPAGRYFELSKPEDKQGSWQKVWQNLDIKRYKKSVPFSVQPAMILLDPDNTAGGFVRDWPKPDFRMDVNRGYAIQWYLMSFALVVIYLVTNLKRTSPEEQINAK